MPYDLMGGLDVLGPSPEWSDDAGLDVLGGAGDDWAILAGGDDWSGTELSGADADLQQLLAGADIQPGAPASAQLAATATAHPTVKKAAAVATQAAVKAVQAARASHPAAPALAAKAVQAAKIAAAHPAAKAHPASKMVAVKAAKAAVTAVKACRGGGGPGPQVKQYLARQHAAKQAALKAGTRDLAMRHAQAIVPRDYTRGRKLVIGIGSTGITDLVAPGASRTFNVQPQIPFKADRFFVESGSAGNFVITDIKIGQQSMFAASSQVPAAVFAETSVDSPVNFDTAQISQQLIVSVINFTGGASPFFGSFRGFSAL